VNFLGPVRQVSRRQPDRPALVEGDRTWTYSELWSAIARAAAAFREQGLEPGDRVALWLPNGAEFLVAHLGLLAAGLVSVPLKSECGPVELEAALAHSRPERLLAHSTLLDKLESGLPAGLVTWTQQDLPTEGPTADAEPHRVPNDHPASVNYSYYFGEGGSHGAVLNHGNYAAAAIGYAKFHGMHSGDRTLVMLPMPHVFTLGGAILSSLYRGACLHVGSSLRPRKVLEYIAGERITQLPCIPQLFEALAAFHDPDRFDLGSLRHLVSGGDFLPADVHARLESRLGVTIVQGYGLTECFPVTCNPPGARNRPGSLGLEGHRRVRYRITDADGLPLPVGETGEIEIASPTVMTGYLDAPEATRRVLRQGWLRTGDRGHVDGDGYLHFDGLLKPILNVRGNNVDPLEVARVLGELEQVAEVRVEGEAEEKGALPSTQLVAHVTPEPGAELGVAQVRAHCRRRLAAYKVPARVVLEPVGG
jgi:acyl-CoA synthetase (AMP-forming)/AMP-acid ligase II